MTSLNDLLPQAMPAPMPGVQALPDPLVGTQFRPPRPVMPTPQGPQFTDVGGSPIQPIAPMPNMDPSGMGKIASQFAASSQMPQLPGPRPLTPPSGGLASLLSPYEAATSGAPTQVPDTAGNTMADVIASGRGVNPNGFTGSSSGAHGIVHLASTQIGAPYVWNDVNPMGGRGGAGSGFDCSGLTSWVMSKFGVNLPHNAAAQQQMLPSLSRHQLQPGDLVFMWYPNSRGIPQGSASHVGIYTGHGQMIAAGSGGVEHQSVDWSAFVGGGAIQIHRHHH